MNPEITVVVPVYKVERYLPLCMESLLSQTYKDFEIILVDDGSPDQCPKMCDEYEEEYSNVHVFHKKMLAKVLPVTLVYQRRRGNISALSIVMIP